jgi:hypothetical protein
LQLASRTKNGENEMKTPKAQKKPSRMLALGALIAIVSAAAASVTALAGQSELYPPLEREFFGWADKVNKYIFEGSNGEISYLEVGDGDSPKITIRTVDKNAAVVSEKVLDFELPRFGGFYSGQNFNFLAFGQKNEEENDRKEVVRIVKYDKSFNRLGSVSVNGRLGEFGNVSSTEETSSTIYVPFDFAPGRMSENGSTLILSFGRTMYDNGDDVHHQRNCSIFVDTADMSIRNEIIPYVSHSLDNFIAFDGDLPVFLQLGDAYPRGLMLYKAKASDHFFKILPDGRESQVWVSDWGSYYDFDGDVDKSLVLARPSYGYDEMVIQSIGDSGSVFQNTGVSIGGFETTQNYFLTVVASVNYPANVDNKNQREIKALLVPRNFSAGSEAKSVSLSQYIGTNLASSSPRLARLDSDRFAVIWAEFEKDETYPRGYVMKRINGNGDILGETEIFKTEEEAYNSLYGITPKIRIDTSGASAWAVASLNEAADNGLATEELSKGFQNATTRAEFCRAAINFVENFYKKPIAFILDDRNLAAKSFSDTKDPAIGAAAALGITSGTDAAKNLFSPSDSLTREQAAAMLARTLSVVNKSAQGNSVSWKDSGSISSYAAEPINTVYAAGVMTGTSVDPPVFSPKTAYTHEQSLSTFQRLWSCVVPQP